MRSDFDCVFTSAEKTISPYASYSSHWLFILHFTLCMVRTMLLSHDASTGADTVRQMSPRVQRAWMSNCDTQVGLIPLVFIMEQPLLSLSCSLKTSIREWCIDWSCRRNLPHELPMLLEIKYCKKKKCHPNMTKCVILHMEVTFWKFSLDRCHGCGTYLVGLLVCYVLAISGPK